MSLSPLTRRRTMAMLTTIAALAGVLPNLTAQAQETSIKFQLDWRFEGPSALFLLPAAKGLFKAEKLNVTVDAGNGSGNAVNRVASGSYDMGFADLAALMEFHANNPTAPTPLAFWKIGNARRPASNTGAPSFLPVRSAGVLMPDFFSENTAAGVLL